MAAPRLSLALAQETVQRVETALREGNRPPGMIGTGAGAIMVAAQTAIDDRWVATYSTFKSRIAAAKTAHGLEPDWGLYRAQRYQQPVPKAVLHPAAPLQSWAPSGEPQRILVVGDLHQDPAHPDRLQILTWIARYASANRFDRIIQVGDWSTFDSVNSHDKNDTARARHKPSVRQDLDNLIASHRAFRAGLEADYKPRLTFLQGNHENRLERFENAHPESIGTYTLERDQIFTGFGWQIRPYGEIFYLNGVGFTHHPNNGAGRAYGGKTGPQRAANDSTCPIVSGHTHRRQVHDSPKIGPVDSISMVEVGCALPWGCVESYAQHAATGWWWGVVPMTVHGGIITDLEFVSMLRLEREFGARMAA